MADATRAEQLKDPAFLVKWLRHMVETLVGTRFTSEIAGAAADYIERERNMTDDIDNMPRLEYHTPNLDLDWLRTQGELAVACANEIAVLRKRLLRYRQGDYHALDESEVKAALRGQVIVKNPHARWTQCMLCRSEWLGSEGGEKHKPGCLAAPKTEGSE